MNKEKENKEVFANGGTNILTTLQLIFLTLKFAGLVDWSWWFVFTPVFISLGLLLVGLVILLIISRK